MPEQKQTQRVFEGPAAYRHLPDILCELNCDRPFVICGKQSYRQLTVSSFLDRKVPGHTLFQEFTSNPDILDACAAKEQFLFRKSDCLVAIGGGSAMDVAKAVKYHLEQKVPLIAMPTTAGTGSESTRFAVVYKDHVKQSLDAPELLPDVVILDPDVLACLPAYPRTCAAFDAMCQAIESWWSPRATEESRSYAKEAIRLMMPVFKRYLDGSSDTFPTMIKAANLAGRAIDITRTTAPHAMSYALTMRCGIAHGHAVTLLLPYVWEYMAERVNTQKETGLAGTFSEIADALFACGVSEAVERLKELNDRYGMCAPQGVRHEDIGNLTASVNEARLNNNPVPLTPEVIANIYRKALTCGTSVSSYQPVTGPGGSRRTI